MGLFSNLLGNNRKELKILAVDTSSSVCSVALLNGKNVIDERNLNNGLTHSENLMPLIDDLIKRNDVDLSQIDCIGICVGPGSFTGIRIGIASILPLAEFNNKKIAPISSLEVLARNVSVDDNFSEELGKNIGGQLYNIDTFKSIASQIKNYSEQITTTTIVPIIDAKNNLVYTGVYDSIYKLLYKEDSLDINDAIEVYKKFDNIVFVGDGAVLYEELLKEKLSDKKISFSEKNSQFAVNVGKGAYERYLNNDLKLPNEIQPLYLRKSQAERLKKIQ